MSEVLEYLSEKKFKLEQDLIEKSKKLSCLKQHQESSFYGVYGFAEYKFGSNAFFIQQLRLIDLNSEKQS